MSAQLRKCASSPNLFISNYIFYKDLTDLLLTRSNTCNFPPPGTALQETRRARIRWLSLMLSRMDVMESWSSPLYDEKWNLDNEEWEDKCLNTKPKNEIASLWYRRRHEKWEGSWDEPSPSTTVVIEIETPSIRKYPSAENISKTIDYNIFAPITHTKSCDLRHPGSTGQVNRRARLRYLYLKLFSKQDVEWGSPLFIALDNEYWKLREDEFDEQFMIYEKKSEIDLLWYELREKKREECWDVPSPHKRAAKEGAAAAGGVAFK